MPKFTVIVPIVGSVQVDEIEAKDADEACSIAIAKVDKALPSAEALYDAIGDSDVTVDNALEAVWSTGDVDCSEIDAEEDELEDEEEEEIETSPEGKPA